MTRLFGTDGVRGLAGGDVLTAELTLAVAQAAAGTLLRDELAAGTRPLVAVGRDTRPSGAMLEAAAVAGFTSVGCDVVRLGVVPTPVVAHAVGRGWSLGLMISASHNAAPDNGLKLFGAGGSKLTDTQEDAVTAALDAPPVRASGFAIGSDRTDQAAATAVEAYLQQLVDTVGSLAGLHVVVDGAEGSASLLAPEAYRRAGATVTTIHCDAVGHQINDGCGATHPESLARAVVELGADLGIAHDGDADRCIVVDAAGRVLNGDQVLGLLALSRKAAGLPGADVLVATVMSNLGLHHAMSAAGITVLQTAVGDRYVLEALHEHGHRLGGEQSGHVVMLDHATTGDGLLTALQVMDRVAKTRTPVAELADVVSLLPQVLVNVRADRSRAVAPDVLAAVAVEEAALAGAGRVLLRPSGTEALVRVMVEAPTQQAAETVAQRLAAVVAS